MAQVVHALRLAYAYVSEAAPRGCRVETQPSADLAGSLPYVVVGTSAPAPTTNGPYEASSQFVISLTVYGAGADSTYDTALAIFAGVHDLWRAGHTTEYGWITHIARDSLHPRLTASDAMADGVARFDAALPVTARQ